MALAPNTHPFLWFLCSPNASGGPTGRSLRAAQERRVDRRSVRSPTRPQQHIPPALCRTCIGRLRHRTPRKEPDSSGLRERLKRRTSSRRCSQDPASRSKEKWNVEENFTDPVRERCQLVPNLRSRSCEGVEGSEQSACINKLHRIVLLMRPK